MPTLHRSSFQTRSKFKLHNGHLIRLERFECFKNCVNSRQIIKYCHGELDSKFYNLFEREIAKNPFGCIELPDSDPICGWHTIGSFNNSNEFVISKFRIKEIINSHFALCPFFDKEYAISQIDEIPDKISPDNINWSIGETFPYMEDYRRLGVILYSFRETNFGYIDKEAVERSITFLEELVKREEASANYHMRETNSIYVTAYRIDDACEACKKLSGEIFRADILLEKWKTEKVIPIPVLGCKNDICRCHWSWNRSELKIKSYLPSLTEEQRILIEKEKISIVTKEYRIKGRDELIEIGSSYLSSIAFMGSPVFKNIDPKDAYFIGLSPIINLLKLYNYAKQHDLETIKMWGFYLKKTISGDLIIYLSEDFPELNKFERLSKFNPKTAKWITDN